MTDARQRELKRLRNLAFLLDNAFEIPVIRYRIGIEPIIGLFPVVGDLIGYVLAAYLIFQARRFGAPTHLLGQMLVNATLDFVVGSVPVLGDIFDFAFKPNARNMRLLERYLSES